jgi:hypothetical protein
VDFKAAVIYQLCKSTKLQYTQFGILQITYFRKYICSCLSPTQSGPSGKANRLGEVKDKTGYYRIKYPQLQLTVTEIDIRGISK